MDGEWIDPKRPQYVEKAKRLRDLAKAEGMSDMDVVLAAVTMLGNCIADRASSPASAVVGARLVNVDILRLAALERGRLAESKKSH